MNEPNILAGLIFKTILKHRNIRYFQKFLSQQAAEVGSNLHVSLKSPFLQCDTASHGSPESQNPEAGTQNGYDLASEL